MLTSRELGDIRNTVEASLPSTCVILTNSPTNDAGAGQLENFTASGTVSCRVRREKEPREFEIGGAIRSVVPVPISLPFDCGVTALNRLRIDSVDFQVIGNDLTRSEPGCLVVLAARVG